jgi:hypothetical protein
MFDFKKSFVWLGTFALILQSLVFGASPVFAYNAGAVIINEIAWAGTADSSNDEWIELYNNTSSEIDLTGWSIEDDGGASVYNILNGKIAPHGYFLIEDSEISVSNVVADAVIGLSLANAGDSLVLKDNSNLIIDTVNGSGGAWHAGNATTKATMERIDPSNKVDSAENWADATSSNGSLGRLGLGVLGTPRGANSNYGGSGPEVSIMPFETDAAYGDEISISVRVDSVIDLYAYGFEIDYDPAVLDFISTEESTFLKANGSSTAFNSSLENGIEGTLVVGNVRLLNPPLGVDGSGELFNIKFEVIGDGGDYSDISFVGDNFLSDSIGSIPVKFSGGSVSVDSETLVDPVQNASVNIGSSRYSLELSWDLGLSGADSYIIKKQLADGSFAVIGETADLSFIDSNNLIPTLIYNYQIIPVKNGQSGPAVDLTGSEDRGLLGDFNRSDRVDGKDLELLARSFGSEYGDEEYDTLCDCNYDGVIDGSDLIDLGLNFGLKYL